MPINGNHWSSVCILVSSGSVCVPQQNHGRSHQNNTSSHIFAYIFCWTKHVFNTQILTATFYRITSQNCYTIRRQASGKQHYPAFMVLAI
ncbi:hypothetical protein Q8A67_001086 [Cirrhinus molitorella]|uniref:Uncharacterized protein n=1 Tax=Cirrhinus molitorella TaxID=172907 RepID=A0AA88QDT9_9TELE|nr:hypothetical protein Q8A67_001086 [Cirrhinus molitorella]